MFGLRLGAMGRVGAGLTLTQQAINILRRPGSESHVYLPGIGWVGGLSLTNAIMEDGTQAASVDNPVGYMGDPIATVGSEIAPPTTSLTGWTTGGTTPIVTSNGTSITVENGAAAEADVRVFAANVVAGRTYEITLTVSEAPSGGAIWVGGNRVALGVGTKTLRLTAASTVTPNGVRLYPNSTVLGHRIVFRDVSVRELVGAIPARQATTANKPILRRGAVNRCLYSQDFSNAGWSASNDITKVSTSNADPLGNPTAVLIQSGSLTTPHLLTAPVFSSFTAGLVYTQTVFIKAGTVSRCQLTFSSTPFGSAQYANFSLTGSGSVLASAGGTASIETSTNGYYRCRFTATCTTSGSGASTAVVFINSDAATRTPSYAGNAADNMLVAFAQLETGSTASPYITTTTAAASSPTGPYWMECDGTDFLSLAAVPFQQADDHAVGVALFTNVYADNYVFSLRNTASTNALVAGMRVMASGIAQGWWRDDATATAAPAVPGAVGLGAPFVMSVAKTGGVRNVRRGLGAGSNDSTVLGATTLNTATLGASVTTTTGGQWNGGVFGAYAVKGTLTLAERDILDRWLAQGAQLTL